MWPGRGRGFTLLGPDAIAMGIVILGVALFINVSQFWTLSPRLARFEEIGKLIATLLVIGGFAFIVLPRLFA